MLALIINLFSPITYAAEKDDWIIRKILLGYRFFETSNSIKVYYVQIQQQRDKEPVVDKKYQIVIYLEKNTPINAENLKEYVENDRSLYYDIYIYDHILGMRAPIFADLSKTEVSEAEVEPYINQALQKIKEDFENPPSSEEIDKQVSEAMAKFGKVSHKVSPYYWFLFIFIAGFLLNCIFIALGKLRKKKQQ